VSDRPLWPALFQGLPVVPAGRAGAAALSWNPTAGPVLVFSGVRDKPPRLALRVRLVDRCSFAVKPLNLKLRVGRWPQRRPPPQRDHLVGAALLPSEGRFALGQG